MRILVSIRIAITGYGVVETDGYRSSALLVVSVHRRPSVPERLELIYHELQVLLARHQPQEVAIEKFFAKTLTVPCRWGSPWW